MTSFSECFSEVLIVARLQKTIIPKFFSITYSDDIVSPASYWFWFVINRQVPQSSKSWVIFKWEGQERGRRKKSVGIFAPRTLSAVNAEIHEIYMENSCWEHQKHCLWTQPPGKLQDVFLQYISDERVLPLFDIWHV